MPGHEILPSTIHETLHMLSCSKGKKCLMFSFRWFEFYLFDFNCVEHYRYLVSFNAIIIKRATPLRFTLAEENVTKK